MSALKVIDPKAFWKLLSGIPVCMLVTRDGPALRARPMGPNVDVDRGEIRFVTQRSSHKADEIADLGDMNLSFIADSDKGQEHYVSVSGVASLTQDRTLIREIWTPNDDTWFPEGPDGPDVAAIRVRPKTAEYWDAAGGGRRYAWISFAPPAKERHKSIGAEFTFEFYNPGITRGMAKLNADARATPTRSATTQ